jgi:DNA-binding response OmpR family regulator
MLKPYVLIVEDEQDLAALVKYTFESQGEADAEVVGNGSAALKAVADRRPDLMILDLMLPVLSGVEVCRLLKSRTETRSIPIIILTAKTSEDDRVQGLELGADDYVTKPFSLRELTARARAVLRRRAAAEVRTSTYHGTRMTADFDAVNVAVDGHPVKLTRREFQLLRYLVQNRNHVISRDRLRERVWACAPDSETRSVDVHVGRLRTKLRDAGGQIETVIGLGYRFID